MKKTWRKTKQMQATVKRTTVSKVLAMLGVAPLQLVAFLAI